MKNNIIRLELAQVSIDHADHKVLQKQSAQLTNRSIYLLKGPSGCGKTSLLNVLAGIERPVQGRVALFEGAEQLALLKHCGYVFQNFNLIEELTPFENIELPLLIRGVSRVAAAREGRRLVREFGLAQIIDRPIRLLSGGEKQRIAFARALIHRPRLLLADEPFNQIDARNKQKLIRELARYYREYRPLIIIAEHGQHTSWGKLPTRTLHYQRGSFR